MFFFERLFDGRRDQEITVLDHRSIAQALLVLLVPFEDFWRNTCLDPLANLRKSPQWDSRLALELVELGEIPRLGMDRQFSVLLPLVFAGAQMPDSSLDLEIGQVLVVGQEPLQGLFQPLKDLVGCLVIDALEIHFQVAVEPSARLDPEELVSARPNTFGIRPVQTQSAR